MSGPGVSYTYISRIEAGQRQPSVRALRTIALRLAVTPEYLETGRDLPPATIASSGSATPSSSFVSRTWARPRRRYAPSLAEAEADGDSHVAARAQFALAGAADRRGRADEVVAVLEDFVELGEAPIGEQPDVYALLGRSYVTLGETPRAIALFTRCLAELRSAGEPNPIVFARFATDLASALVEAGDAAPVPVAQLAEALRRADGVTDRQTLVRLYWSLGRIHAVAGPPGRALDYVRRAIALLEATEDMFHLARAHQLARGGAARPGRGARGRRLLKTEQARLQLQLGIRRQGGNGRSRRSPSSRAAPRSPAVTRGGRSRRSSRSSANRTWPSGPIAPRRQRLATRAPAATSRRHTERSASSSAPAAASTRLSTRSSRPPILQ